MNQEYKHHGSRHRRSNQQGLDPERVIGNIDGGLFLDGLDADATNQQPVGVDAVGGAGEERAVIHAFHDEKVLKFGGGDDLDLVHLIGQDLVQDRDLEGIAQFQSVQIGKELGAGRPLWADIILWVLGPPTGRLEPSMCPAPLFSTSSEVPW